MKKEIIICAASVVATLGVTKLPDLLSNVTVITQPTTETVQETTQNQTDDKTNELLEQILVELGEDEATTEKETVDNSKTENNSTTNSSSTQTATTNTATPNKTQTASSSSNSSSSTTSKPATSIQVATAQANKGTSTASSTSSKPATQTATASSQVKTTVARAKEIAVARVGGGTITEFSQDFDDRVPNYDVTIKHGNAEYDLEISAVDGSVLSFDVEYDKMTQKPSSSTSSSSSSKPSNSTSSSTSKPSNSTPSSNIKITAAKAKEIAIAQAGGGTVTDFSQEFDERVPKYEVTVRNGNTEYDFDISAVDGSILSREVDHEDDWD